MASAATLNLIYFVAKRFKDKKEKPPQTFIFVGLSLIFWTLANILLSLETMEVISLENWSLAWQQLLLQGILLGLILGVGGKIIPTIFG